LNRSFRIHHAGRTVVGRASLIKRALQPSSWDNICQGPQLLIPIVDLSQISCGDSMAQPPDGPSFPDELTREADARQSDTSDGTPHRFAVNQIIAGRFRVVRFIARGGMGEIYEAEDQTLRVLVALKAIRHEIAGDPMAIERFRREILLARQVTHPNICRLFDVFVHRLDNGDEILFLTMELLDGRTLAEELVGRGPMRESEALPLVSQLVSALDAAHGVGVVHRDFKSTNVMMIGDRGHSDTRVVVTDFGLARGRLTGLTGENSLTGVAAFLGTPAYMAPEQVMGAAATSASDIYALGIVMYEMVTNTKPFSGDSPLSVATRRLHEAPVSPRVLKPGLKTPWEQVILKCLERRPEDRYATVRDVEDALTEPPRPAVAAAATRGRLAIALAISVGLLLGGFFATRSMRRPARADIVATHSPAARKAVAVLGFRNLSGDQQTAWVSKALAEMLATELSSGGHLRTIPGENVARMKREFSLVDTDSLARDTLVRIRESLGTDVVVLGSYVILAGGQIRLDLRMQDAAAGETLLASAETGTESGLFDLVVRAGIALRRSLGVAELQAAEVDTLRADCSYDARRAETLCGRTGQAAAVRRARGARPSSTCINRRSGLNPCAFRAFGGVGAARLPDACGGGSEESI
jgi:TolB-like protein/tRNA A-37 threonylcarbamoyl transferase component Bud32